MTESSDLSLPQQWPQGYGDHNSTTATATTTTTTSPARITYGNQVVIPSLLNDADNNADNDADNADDDNDADNDVDHVTIKLFIRNACWKTNDQVEFDHVSGDLYVTSDQVIFSCLSHSEYSVAIDAECILLHAQSEDDVLYLQLQQPDDDNDDDSELMDLTLTMSSEEDCHQLFKALSHLVTMHPVHDDDGDDDGYNNMMMMGAGGDEYGDDMIVAPSVIAGGDPTEEERNAMLDRLDAMLVVPPMLEKEEDEETGNEHGQFDDADDDLL